MDNIITISFDKIDDSFGFRIEELCEKYKISDGWEFSIPEFDEEFSKVSIRIEKKSKDLIHRQLFASKTNVPTKQIYKKFTMLFPKSEGFLIDAVVEYNLDTERQVLVSVSKPYDYKKNMSNNMK